MNGCTYIVASRGGAVDRRESVNGGLLARLLSSTALASVLLLLPSTSSAQTVTVQEGATVSIPGDHQPDAVSRVNVNSGGTLITNDANIEGAVNGAGVINVNNGKAIFNGGSVSNITKDYGDALRVSGAAATVEATGLALKTKGSFQSSGEPSSGAYASWGATINLMDGSVVTTGDYGYAIRTAGDGSHIDANGLTITTGGLQGIGVQAYGNHDKSTRTTI